MARRLCVTSGSLLRLVHVRTWDPPVRSSGRFFLETSEEATAVLENALTGLWATGASASGIVVDVPRSLVAGAIAVEACSWGADVVVMTRRGTVFRLLRPVSLSDQVTRRAPCPVVVVQTGRR